MVDGMLIYEVVVPDDERRVEFDDTPKAYRVVVPHDVDVACMVYGLYRDRWEANPSCRWLVRHLIDRLAEIERNVTIFGG